MEGIFPFVLEAVLIAVISVLGTVVYLDRREKSRIKIAREQADKILAEAENQRRDAAIAAKDEAIRLRGRSRSRTDPTPQRDRTDRASDRAKRRDDRPQVHSLDQRENAHPQAGEQAAEQRTRDLGAGDGPPTDQEIDQARGRHLAGTRADRRLTADEAKQELVAEVEAEARDMAARAAARDRAGDQRRSRPALAQDPGDHHPAHRHRLRRRIDRLGRAAAQRRHEGPDHRPRRPQHPRPRAGDRRRPDRRRHAGSDHGLRLRPGPARGRPAGACKSCCRTAASTRPGSRRSSPRRSSSSSR